jgi:hypothetical protein
MNDKDKKSQEEKIKELLDQGFTHDQVMDLLKAGKLDNNIDLTDTYNTVEKYFKIISNWILSHKKPVIGLIAIILIVGIGFNIADNFVQSDNTANSTKIIKNNDIKIDNVGTSEFKVDATPDSLGNQYYTYKMNFDLTSSSDYNNASIECRFKSTNGTSIGYTNYAKKISAPYDFNALNITKDDTTTYIGTAWGNIKNMGTVAPSKVLITVIDNEHSRTLLRQEFDLN